MTASEAYDPRALGLRVSRIVKDEALCFCDYHSDSHPSASFNTTKGVFVCWSCGTVRSAVQLARDLGGTVTRQRIDVERKRHSDEEWRWITQAPLAIGNEYLSKRGVTDEQVRRHSLRDIGIGVAFPILRPNGEVTGYQIRKRMEHGGPKYITLGEKQPLWPMNRLSTVQGTLYIVEGAFGVLNAENYGISAFATMGASSAVLASRTGGLAGRSRILFDDDFAGYVGAAKLMMRTGSPAACPGGPADEIDWSLAEYRDYTLSVDRLAQASKDPAKFKRMVMHGSNRD